MIPDDQSKKRVKEWAERHGFTLRITNEGQHWSFYKEGKQLFQWWPSSGRLVIDQKWTNALFARSANELFAEIEKRLGQFYNN